MPLTNNEVSQQTDLELQPETPTPLENYHEHTKCSSLVYFFEDNRIDENVTSQSPVLTSAEGQISYEEKGLDKQSSCFETEQATTATSATSETADSQQHQQSCQQQPIINSISFEKQAPLLPEHESINVRAATIDPSTAAAATIVIATSDNASNDSTAATTTTLLDTNSGVPTTNPSQAPSPSLSGLFSSLAEFWGPDGTATTTKRRKLNETEESEVASLGVGATGALIVNSVSAENNISNSPLVVSSTPTQLLTNNNGEVLLSVDPSVAPPTPSLPAATSTTTTTTDEYSSFPQQHQQHYRCSTDSVKQEQDVKNYAENGSMAIDGLPSTAEDFISVPTLSTVSEELSNLKARMRNSLLPVVSVYPWLRFANILSNIISQPEETSSECLMELQEAVLATAHLPDMFFTRKIFPRLLKAAPPEFSLQVNVLLANSAEPDEQSVIIGVVGSPLFLQFAQAYMRYASLPKIQTTFLADFKRLYLLLVAARLTGLEPLTKEGGLLLDDPLASQIASLSKIQELFLERYRARVLDNEVAELYSLVLPSSPHRSRPRPHRPSLPKLSAEDLVLILQRIVRQFDALDATQLAPLVGYLASCSGGTNSANNANKRLAVQKFTENIQISRIVNMSKEDLFKEIADLQEVVQLLKTVANMHKPLLSSIVLEDVPKSIANDAPPEDISAWKAHLSRLHFQLAEVEFCLIDAGSATLEDFLVTSAISSMALHLFYSSDGQADGESSDTTLPGDMSSMNRTETGKDQIYRRRRGRPLVKKQFSNIDNNDNASQQEFRINSANNSSMIARTSSDEEDKLQNASVVTDDDDEFRISYRNGVPQSGRRGVIWHQAGRAWDATWAAMGKQQHKLFYVKDLGMKGALEAAIRFRQDVEKSRVRRNGQ